MKLKVNTKALIASTVALAVSDAHKRIYLFHIAFRACSIDKIQRR